MAAERASDSLAQPGDRGWGIERGWKGWRSVRTSVCSDDEKSRLSSRWGHHAPVPVLDSRKPDVR